MAEHSKGTWHAAQVVEGDTWVETEEPAGEFRPIAEMLGRYETRAGRKEMLANARLMAAAPDLLAACERLRDILRNDENIRVQSNWIVSELAFAEAAAAVDAAIAKAKGGA